MLTPKDLAERFNATIDDIAGWHATKVLPEPVRIGGKCRWRVEDIDLFEDYLRARMECRERGLNPDSVDGPSVPVYSMGLTRFDPREAMARIRERERQAKSKTLRAGSAPIGPQPKVEMPEAAKNSTKVEG